MSEQKWIIIISYYLTLYIVYTHHKCRNGVKRGEGVNIIIANIEGTLPPGSYTGNIRGSSYYWSIISEN